MRSALLWVVSLFVGYTNLLFAVTKNSSCPVVTTFYGELSVCEPVVQAILASPAMQRLKKVNQYGISNQICHTEPYNRYDHSLGVFYLLRIHNRPLTEQLAGLLHDVSHTAFSHLGDVFFHHSDGKDSYQDSMHLSFLRKYGIEEVLHKYGFTLKDVDHKRSDYNALEQELPDTCADRLDYNIQGAFYSHVISREEAKEMADDLHFLDGKWNFSRVDLALKLSRYSIHMSKHCWSSAESYLANSYLSQALKRAIQLGAMTELQVEFGTDAVLWQQLQTMHEPFIKEQLLKIQSLPDNFEYTEAKAEAIKIHTKFRGIDPFIRRPSTLLRLTQLDRCFRSEFMREKNFFTQAIYIREKPI